MNYVFGPAIKKKNRKFTVKQTRMIKDYVASDYCPFFVDVIDGK